MNPCHLENNGQFEIPFDKRRPLFQIVIICALGECTLYAIILHVK